RHRTHSEQSAAVVDDGDQEAHTSRGRPPPEPATRTTAALRSVGGQDRGRLPSLDGGLLVAERCLIGPMTFENDADAPNRRYATLRRDPSLNAPGRTTRNPGGRTTTNDPDRTTPNGPGRAKCAMPANRIAKPALAWRYPMRTPARVRITSPPKPGRATAASAHSEAARGRSLQACWNNDRKPFGMALWGAGGASPASDDTP